MGGWMVGKKEEGKVRKGGRRKGRSEKGLKEARAVNTPLTIK